MEVAVVELAAPASMGPLVEKRTPEVEVRVVRSP
jgi:hypothetical protein